MYSTLVNCVKTQIENLEGFNFQRFVVELLLCKYGGGFMTLRERKDKGSDGIIISENASISCYGSASFDIKKFSTKVDDDFLGYNTNYQSIYSNWIIIINVHTPPDAILKADKVYKNSRVWGIGNLISIFESLSWAKRIKLARFLNINDATILSRDILKEILDDLLNKSSTKASKISYSSPLNIEDKINLNYDPDDVESVLTEYNILDKYFPTIYDTLYPYEDDDKSKIKIAIINKFNQQKGSFKEKFDSLHDFYLNRYSDDSDDEYNFFIRAFLFYIFEQCLIGRKV